MVEGSNETIRTAPTLGRLGSAREMSDVADTWDETTRPTLDEPGGRAVLAGRRRPTAEHLVEIHDHLRSELTRLHGLVDEVRRGRADGGRGRGSEVHAMSLRQNNWTLGAYCQSYCGFVNGHHTLEDASVFPHLRRAEPDVAPVLDRLHEEHLVIHHLLDDVDRRWSALVRRRRRRRRSTPSRRRSGRSATGCSATWPTRSASCAARSPATASTDATRTHLECPRDRPVHDDPAAARRWRGSRRGSWTRSSAGAA